MRHDTKASHTRVFGFRPLAMDPELRRRLITFLNEFCTHDKWIVGALNMDLLRTQALEARLLQPEESVATGTSAGAAMLR